MWKCKCFNCESWVLLRKIQCDNDVSLLSKFGVTFPIRSVCANVNGLISNENKIESDGISSATPSMQDSERHRCIRSLDTRERCIKSVLFFRSLNESVPILQMRNRPTDKNANRTLDEKYTRTKQRKITNKKNTVAWRRKHTAGEYRRLNHNYTWQGQIDSNTWIDDGHHFVMQSSVCVARATAVLRRAFPAMVRPHNVPRRRRYCRLVCRCAWVPLSGAHDDI